MSIYINTVAALSVVLTVSLTGCGIAPTASPAVRSGVTIQGNLHGGEQPVVGSHVYLMAANNSGYGAPSLSLLNASATGQADSIGAYVLTDKNGSFSITGDYTCSSGSQVYVFALGGNPGAGPNSAAGFMSVLGACPGTTFPANTFVYVNEVTTIASAFSLAGYAVDATHMSTSGNPAALYGIANAAAMFTNLVSPSKGVANSFTPAGNGTVPLPTINTLANILASCVNTTGPSSAPCTTLFANAPSGGTSSTTPTNTADAAINIAHNPGAHVGALFGLTVASSPYPFSLAAQPRDFTLGINFRGGGLNQPLAVAIDSFGNAWFTNLGNSAISKLSPLGAPLSPVNGFLDSLGQTAGLAIDLTGNAWVVDSFNNKLAKFSNSGVLLTSPAGYTGGGLNGPQEIAIDGTGNVWVTNYNGSGGISEFASSGLPLSPAAGFTGGGLNGPVGITIDAAGAVWATNPQNTPNDLSKLDNSGGALSPPTGYFGGGLNTPFDAQVDATGNIWTANHGNSSVSKFTNNGVALSPAAGYAGAGMGGPYGLAIDGGGNVWVANNANSSVSELSNNGTALSPNGFAGGNMNSPATVAIDGSGNVWVPNAGALDVTLLVGAAVPKVVPLALAVKNNTIAARP
jgi:streptogramin lyase